MNVSQDLIHEKYEQVKDRINLMMLLRDRSEKPRFGQSDSSTNISIIGISLRVQLMIRLTRQLSTLF